MKLYAIRDKLISYYMTPFAAPNDKDVLAGIANAVNNLEENSAISKAPHHFEIWCLGEVTEDGHLEVNKYLVADANSLVRENLRAEIGHTTMGRPVNGSQRASGEETHGAGTYPKAP